MPGKKKKSQFVEDLALGGEKNPWFMHNTGKEPREYVAQLQSPPPDILLVCICECAQSLVSDSVTR